MKVVTPEGEMQLKPPTEEDIAAMKKCSKESTDIMVRTARC